MWKIGLGAIGVFGAVAGFSSGAKLAGIGSSDPAKPFDVVRVLSDEAERANKKKGSVNGHTTFVGATVREQKLSYQYELALNARAVNATAAKEEFYRKALPLACKADSAMRRALIQGASIEYVYRTATTKQYLFEVNLNGSSCRA